MRPQSGQGVPGGHIDIRFVGHAVLAGIRALVDEAAVAQRGEQLLHAALVALLRGADEVVVAQPQPVPQPAELGGDRGGKLHRRAPGQFGGALDLLPVLVGPGQEPCVDAQRPLAPRDGVAHDGRVGVPQVRPRIHVVDRRGEIKVAGAARDRS